MENGEYPQPPSLWLAFFRWYCRAEFVEEIEGDLLERFQDAVEHQGIKKARSFFAKEVLLLFRPGIIGHIRHLTFNLFTAMKTLQWLQLVALNLLVILCIFLPFLPGPYDQLALVFSNVAQVTGVIGLLLVPIGILWLIQEIRKLTGHNTAQNNWSSGYYFAITATGIVALICLVLIVALLGIVGPSAAIIALVLIALVLIKSWPAIKKLKLPTKVFNATPLYLLSVPVIAFTVRLFFISPAGAYSRDYAIGQASGVIQAIESYYTQRGSYPESLDHLYDLPKPAIMGIDKFRYERNGAAYNLSFVQWQHFGATEEIVMYNKNDEHNVKGHFASYNAQQPHWRYYWLD